MLTYFIAALIFGGIVVTEGFPNPQFGGMPGSPFAATGGNGGTVTYVGGGTSPDGSQKTQHVVSQSSGPGFSSSSFSSSSSSGDPNAANAILQSIFSSFG